MYIHTNKLEVKFSFLFPVSVEETCTYKISEIDNEREIKHTLEIHFVRAGSNTSLHQEMSCFEIVCRSLKIQVPVRSNSVEGRRKKSEKSKACTWPYFTTLENTAYNTVNSTICCTVPSVYICKEYRSNPEFSITAFAPERRNAFLKMHGFEQSFSIYTKIVN